MRTPALLPSLLLALLLPACGPDAETDAVAVRVGGIALDPTANAPVVILEEVDGTRTLPIWIGVAEARSILAGLEEEVPVRPNTHDLAKSLVEGLHADVRHVIVRALEEGIYYADVVLGADGRELRVDARPSDAIALALRAKAPLFVREPLFEAEMLPQTPSGEGRRIRFEGAASGRQLRLRSL